jgi:hypothetical protein
LRRGNSKWQETNYKQIVEAVSGQPSAFSQEFLQSLLQKLIAES